MPPVQTRTYTNCRRTLFIEVRIWKELIQLGTTRGTKRNDLTPQVSKEEITRYTENALQIFELDPIDTSDEKQVAERIRWYFNHCAENGIRPGQAGLCFALGVNRSTFYRWTVGENRGATHQNVAKRAQALLETLWEQYMLNGKINPVTGIFLAKNNFGYTDKQELEIAPKAPMVEGLDTPELIAAKYAELPDDD